MKYIFYVLLLVSGIASIAGCENDIELNAPYKETTIIFGVLDIGADTQFIRINKTFLGDGNALDMALIKDSSEYDPTTVNAYLLKNDETPSEENKLQYTTIAQRDPGVFYDQNVIIYYSTRPLLDAEEDYLDVTYHLEVQIGDKIVKGSTKLVKLKVSNIKRPTGNLAIDPSSSAGLTLMTGTNYIAKNIEVESPVNAKRFEAAYVLNFNEEYLDGTSELKSIVYNAGVQKTEKTDGGSLLSFGVNTEGLYSFWGQAVDANPNIKHRAVYNIETVVTISAEDLSTYIDINQPISGIVTERPVFTNIENGIGIFSSKFTFTKTKTVGGGPNSRPDTYKEFKQGQYTNNACFCDTLPGSSYNCNVLPSCN